MKKFFALSLTALVLGGCCSDNLTSISSEEVCINSSPICADVFINGEFAGQTPMCVSLDKSSPQEVVIKKEGYKDATFALAAIATNPFVKFPDLESAGFYGHFDQNPVCAALLPSFLPAAPKGENDFDGLADAIAKANKLQKEGKICEHEYSEMVKNIKNFYAPNAEAEIAAEATKPAVAVNCDGQKVRCPACNK